MVRRISTDCCNIYANRIRKEDQPATLKMLITYWGKSQIGNETAPKMLGISLSQYQDGQAE